MKENSNRGGARKGAGRKPVVEELAKNALIQKAVNSFYSTDNDSAGKEALIKDLLGFERGMMFIAEHLLGKPKETIENINIDAGKLTDEEIKKINDNLEQSY